MITGFWGKKIGMTQVFVDDVVVPTTVIDIGAWYITQIKTVDTDGYDAVQVGLVKKKYADQMFSSLWLKKPKVYFERLREIRITASSDMLVGSLVTNHEQLVQGDKVDVFGKTKGCGFAGVVRRHGFAGPPASHGHTMGKRPGSLGGACSQGKVRKGKKMPGHMGDKNRMMAGLEVVKVDTESRAVLVKGSVPGKSGSLVFVRKV